MLMFASARRHKLLIISYYVPMVTWYQSTAPKPTCCWQKHRRCMEKKLKYILSYIKKASKSQIKIRQKISVSNPRDKLVIETAKITHRSIFFSVYQHKKFLLSGFWGYKYPRQNICAEIILRFQSQEPQTMADRIFPQALIERQTQYHLIKNTTNILLISYCS